MSAENSTSLDTPGTHLGDTPSPNALNRPEPSNGNTATDQPNTGDHPAASPDAGNATVANAEEPQAARRSSRARKPTNDSFVLVGKSKASKPRMTPACGNCRQSKIWCKHRSIISDDGSEEQLPSRKRKRVSEDNTAGTVSKDAVDNESGVSSEEEEEEEEAEAISSPRAKKLLRVRWKLDEEEEDEVQDDIRVRSSPSSSSSSSSSSDHEGRVSDPEGQDAVHRVVHARENTDIETPASAGLTGQSTTITSVMSKTPRRQRRQPKQKEKTKTGSSDPEAVSQTTTTTDAVRAGAGEPRFPAFPADNLKGAAQLSVHSVYSLELQMRLEECENHWRAAIESLHSVKQTLDRWVGSWQKGH